MFQVYHKPPTAFVEGTGGFQRVLPTRPGDDGVPPAQIIPEPGSIIGDLLSMDLGGGSAAAAGGNVDLLSGNYFSEAFVSGSAVKCKNVAPIILSGWLKEQIIVALVT